MSLHTPETIYSIYALNQLGAIVNLIYLTLNAEEILKQTDEVGSKMFLYLENVQDKVKEIKSKNESRTNYISPNLEFHAISIKTDCKTEKLPRQQSG